MSYGVFAAFYDKLTANVNYRGYAKRVDLLLKQRRPNCVDIAEIACGTGNLGAELEKFGYRTVGIDLSEEMIKIAEKKAAKRFSDAVFIRDDMRSFRLGSPADAAVSSLDALNHLKNIMEVRETFSAVRRNLRPGGVFIFDMNTPYKHREILGCNSFVYELPEVYTVWQNDYRPKDRSVGITLDFFIKNGSGYTKSREVFRERAYPEREIAAALRSCGFRLLGTFDGLKNRPPVRTSERILYVARRT